MTCYYGYETTTSDIIDYCVTDYNVVYNLTYDSSSDSYSGMTDSNGTEYTFYNYSVTPTQVYYMHYDTEGYPYYILGDGGYRYYRHEFFTGPFDYDIYHCDDSTSSGSWNYTCASSDSGEYCDALLDKVYQNDGYIDNGYGNEYHYIWLSSCDGVNYFYNNENGWSWRLKAFRDEDGNIDFFKFDTDNIYYDDGESY